MNNLRIYEAVRTVPEEAKKPISAGRLKGMTDINPMWRIQKLTEVFGTAGFGWWTETVRMWTESAQESKETMAFVHINLFVRDPATGEVSHGITGIGGSKLEASERNGFYASDEAYKMAYTDAISVAAKALGMGADVYYAAGRSKYTAAEPETTAICESCGKEIKPYISDKTGNEVSVKSHVAQSRLKFGKCLCLDCIRKPNPVDELMQNYAEAQNGN